MIGALKRFAGRCDYSKGGKVVGIKVCNFSRRTLHLSWYFGQVFIPLPNRGFKREAFGDEPQYGIDMLFRDGHKGTLYMNWGQKCKFIYMPWEYEHYRTRLFTADGNWIVEPKDYAEREALKPILWTEKYNYDYRLRSGDVQEAIATVTVHEAEYRMRGFMWLPLFRHVDRYIDVQFDRELGEGAGSWKGGVLGTGYKMLPNETARECLYRMQKERKFSR